MPISRAEAQEVTERFVRDYPGAAALAYRFRSDRYELYGQRGDQLPPQTKGGYSSAPLVFHGRQFNGRVDVPLDAITDKEDMRLTLRHEVLGHYGINTFPPEEKRALLDALIAARDQPSLKPDWNRVDRVYAGDSLAHRAEEVFSFRAEALAPNLQLVARDVEQRGREALQATCLDRTRPLQGQDLDSIVRMVEHGLHTRTRTQQTFPEPGQQYRKDEMEPIQRRGFTDPVKLAAETAAIEMAEKRTEQVLAAYQARPDTFGGRYVAADTFKELMPGFAESRESRSALNGAVHNAAAVLSAEQFRRLVSQPPTEDRDRVVFVTGIPGAGKSSSITSAIADRAAVVFEGQLNNPRAGIEKIDQALRAGYKVDIVAVHVPPELALERTHSRFLDPNNGRGASINVMTDIQAGLPDGLRQIEQRFGQDVRLTVYDNTPGRQSATDGWAAIRNLEKEGNHDQIKQRLQSALEAGHTAGYYSDRFYQQAAGRWPERRLDERNHSAGHRHIEAHGNRPGLSAGNQKQNALSPYAQGKAIAAAGMKPSTPVKTAGAQPGIEPPQGARGRGR